MDRTNFYTSVTVDGTQELDFLWNPLSAFTMEYDPTYYRVTAVDDMRLRILLATRYMGQFVFGG